MATILFFFYNCPKSFEKSQVLALFEKEKKARFKEEFDLPQLEETVSGSSPDPEPETSMPNYRSISFSAWKTVSLSPDLGSSARKGSLRSQPPGFFGFGVILDLSELRCPYSECKPQKRESTFREKEKRERKPSLPFFDCKVRIGLHSSSYRALYRGISCGKPRAKAYIESC